MMQPEQFAAQFFDLWQQSAGQMMRDPAFSQKMLELMQQSSQLWPHASPPPVRPAPDDGAGAKSADELAHRLELCEQRLASIEILIRQWAHATTELSSGAARSSYPEE